MMNPRNTVVVHRLLHHRRNPRTKRTLQVFKLDNRHLRITRRLQRGDVFERSSIRLRHSSLRNSRYSQHKSQHHRESLHSATHSSAPLRTARRICYYHHLFCLSFRSEAEESAVALPLQLFFIVILRRTGILGERFLFTGPGVVEYPPRTPFMAQSHRDMSGLSRQARAALCGLRPHPTKPHANFQSTTPPLTHAINLTQTPTVRRRPGCTI